MAVERCSACDGWSTGHYSWCPVLALSRKCGFVPPPHAVIFCTPAACPDCKGTGEIMLFIRKSKCTTCNGTGSK